MSIGERATADGTNAMRREARIRGTNEVFHVCQTTHNHRERAVWAFIAHPILFAQPALCCRMDGFARGCCDDEA